jgi:crotonobetaine/carnitine-CoA ligase
MNAQTTSTMASIMAGACLILTERFSAKRFWDQIKRYKPTVFNYIGAILSILENLPESPFDREHTVTRCWGGGAPKEQIERVERRYELTVLEGYGSTEAAIVTGAFVDKSRPRKLGSVGMPVAGKEVKIFDENDKELPPGQVGEIVIKGTGLMKGYYKEPEATAEAMKGGWFHSGDTGYKDEEGFFFFTGRKKDIIRRSGENISSVEVETVIKSHPKILDAAVLGAPDEIRREEVKAYVILKPGETEETVTPNEIISYCDERLAYFKVPRYIEYREHDFPRTPTGRIKKYEMKKEKEDLTEGCFDKEKAKV